MGSLASHPPTSLLAEVCQRSTLDIAQMADRDDNGIIRIEILGIKLMFGRDDLRSARIAIFFLNLKEFVLHHLLTKFRIIENRLQVDNLSLQLIKLSV